MSTRHNVDPQQMHMAIMGRLQAGVQVPFLFDAEEAFFIARMIEYVSASTSIIQEVIHIIEAETIAPSNGIQNAHLKLLQLRGNPTP